MKAFKLLLTSLLMLLLSSCISTSKPKPLIVKMADSTGATLHHLKNKKIQINISKNLPDSNFLGGDDGTRPIKLINVTPWLAAKLTSLKKIKCLIHKRKHITISLRKLYVNYMSETIIGNAELTAKYKNKPMPTYYTGSCVSDFFYIREAAEIRSCLTTALEAAIYKLKTDICKQGVKS
ncbi:MAG: hypothetical protein K0U12_01220 [Gammaproteobacteria bacterium]|nr:hypothetical protein [Gammaproteobacteria bacterium]